MQNARLIVSLDFELFWGMQDVRSLDSYRPNILGGRDAIPRMLDLCQKYGIHVTWATVGFMFARNAEEAKRYFPNETRLPTYTDPSLSSYRCFSRDVQEESNAACFFAPDLIKRIATTPGMEIASHTFSHYYCREAGQTMEQFTADIQAAREIAEAAGYPLTSIVLPRNQCEPEYTRKLCELGFTAYRDEENDWIHERIRIQPLKRALRLMDVYFPLTGQGGFIPQKEQGIWNLVGSRMYKPFFKPLFFLEKRKIHRIKRQMLHAAKNGLTFHLWWHPHNVGVMTEYHMEQLEEIFSYYEVLHQQYGMQSLNMRETVEQLEQEESNRSADNME